jgi:CHAT domain-containing protein
MKLGSEFLAEPDDAAAVSLLEQYPELPLDAIRTMAAASARFGSDDERGRLERRIQLLDRWPQIRLARAMQRAQAAEARLSSSPDLEHLRAAAQASDAVVAAFEGVGVPAASAAGILGHTMQLQMSVWVNAFDVQALDRAIACGVRAEALQPGAVVEMLGTALVSRYEARGDTADLDEAIARLEAALPGDRLDGHDGRLVPLATTLANALRHRSVVSGHDDDMNRAVALYERIASHPAAEPAIGRVRQLNLSSGLMTRYDQLGDLRDLERAIALMRVVLEAAADEEPSKATVANNLGLALLKQFAVTRERQQLAEALGAATASVRLLQPGAPEAARNLTNCGVCYLECYRTLKKPEMLEAAVEALLHAADVLQPAGVEASRAPGMASEALMERYAASAAPADLERALELAGRAVQATTPGDGLHPGAVARLARALRLRSESPSARAGDRQDAIDRFREGVTAAVRETPLLGIEVALQWGHWAGDRQAWDEAAEAHLLAMDAHRRVLESQQDRLTRELRLERVQGLGGLAALALVRAGRLEDAVQALERGRGLLSAEALNRRPEDVTFDAIAERAVASPLVYLEDVDGGLALIVTAGGVRALALPELREETVNDWLRGHLQLRLDDPEQWDVRLTAFCRWLWDAAMGPLLEALHGHARITLVPCGLLGMLPLHAAWTDDASSPTGRRYAVDTLTIQYAPGASLLRADDAPAFASMLGVDEPAAPGAAPLPHSREEVAAASAHVAQAVILRGADATRDQVLARVHGHDVLHVSCHGAASVSRPLDNGFLMAGGEFLTLRDLLNVQLDTSPIAVLSACDAGQMGSNLPDEAVGLPAGLLQAGARAVVSPLWLIGSFSACVLLARFYEYLCVDRLGAADALCAAQRWMRDTTNADKAAHFAAIPAIRRSLVLREPGARDDASIATWAAFTCYGTES